MIEFQKNGVDAVFLPYLGQNGEQWLLTYPQFQVALNRDLGANKARQEKAMQVLNAMLSEEAQNILSKGGDVITYSQNLDLHRSPWLENLSPLIAQNHMYIRIASADSFTGTVLKADYTEKMVKSMIMPNGLWAWQREMTGAELKEALKGYVEGMEGGFKPFNRGSLPIISGISMEVEELEGAYSLIRVRKDGKEIKDDDTFHATCLNTAARMAPFLKDESRVFEREQQQIRPEWTDYILNGGTLAEPENYITLY